MDATKAGQRVSTTLKRFNRPAYERLKGHRRSLERASRALFGMITILVLWDVVLATNGQAGDTWSEQARLAAPGLPILPWVLGAMVGHIFPLPPQPSRLRSGEASAGAMMVLAAVFLIWTCLIQVGVEVPIQPPAFWVAVLIGVASSYVLWPMSDEASESAAQ